MPQVELGAVPFWRQYLRGFSQCAFQANEITGLLRHRRRVVQLADGHYVISVLIATVVARLLNADQTLSDLGLFGFNPV